MDKQKTDPDLSGILYEVITSVLPYISQDLGGKLADRIVDRLMVETVSPATAGSLLSELESLGRINRALNGLIGLGGTSIPQMPNRSLAQLADKLEATCAHVNCVISSYETDHVELRTLRNERRIVRGYFGVKE